jgi:hypothetical protein
MNSSSTPAAPATVALPGGACFPVITNEKTPAVDKWPTWAGTIAPGQNYGIKTGPASGVWVLDLDVRPGKSGILELQKYAAAKAVELPETFTVRTPSGGEHRYFLWCNDRPVRNRTGVLPGADCRGQGGYVVGPGSTINGKPYEVVRDLPVAEAPEWLVELVAAKAEASPALSVVAITPEHSEYQWRCAEARRYLDNASPCVSGQGGQALIWDVAVELTRGFELPITTCVDLLERYNARCAPPWTEKELQRHLTNAANNSNADVGITGWRARGFAEFCGLLAANDATPVTRGFTLTALDLSRDPEPIEWAVEKVFAADSVNLLVAPSGSLKTWTMLSMALALSTGTSWLDAYAAKQCRVLIVDWESGRTRVHRRLRLLAKGRDAVGVLYLRGPGSLHDPKFWQTLRETIEDYDIGAVLYDSLAAGSGGVDENTVQAAFPLQQAALIDGVTHIFIHHAGKTEQKKNAVARGSSAIQAAADTIYRFSDPEGSQASALTCQMLLAKAGDGEQEERVPLRLTNDGGLQLDTDGTAPHGELSTSLLDLLRTSGPLSASDIAGRLGKRKGPVLKECKALAADGYLVQIERKYRIDSEGLRYGRVLVARANRISQRAALAQQAHVKATDLDAFAAKGWLRRERSEFYPPLTLPVPLGFLGLSGIDAAAVLESMGQTA